MRGAEQAIRMEIADGLRTAKRGRMGNRECSDITIRVQVLGLNRPERIELLDRIADQIEKPSERTP